ncbi:MAG: DUF1467 family protein [Paracoccus sp. (in: a-proteobacteria)]|jgi:predicted secreted protein|uniref:DUF1467 family protein n=1 Tax=unclassified Paracoccus (in: a-proteobacteria) TaxID=2688777 RepID=UPI000C4938A8|nr:MULTISPECIES: DUF1467 family protein [unclassified Paracoccus (in: a-proteobacteria)]MAN55878.1 hypothetical protein [Paracoccus sp. (in: a-proteobacteria)]MCS5602007.1 DUF1467 family protein [Paracoccus sp. (in: a-proteobacteria)]MDB2551108.1 DUF1467 family protein [Paracoccus sp. (in: a-proteobacteria)]HIC65476.1 DUF1467 family protein [Paracoccus sp. (in: a-proteobacteria)]|tara:strand:- start:2401 stop:2670 length:270 start_codon:yes stop_codon:yes gene_type:complete
MNLTAGIILYFIYWFLTLFVVMPIGQKSQQDVGQIVPGTPAGAPVGTPWKRKLIVVTAITTILWAITASLILGGGFTRADVQNFDRFLR